MSILNENIPQEVTNGVLIDIMRSIVEGLGYHYEHGHPTDVLQRLMTMDKDPVLRDTKYPVVCLFQDFPEVNGVLGIDFVATCHIVIANGTKADYTAEQRYANNFRPILYPMYKAIITAIFESGYFMLSSEYDTRLGTKMDRVFWGKNGLYGVDGNIFQDRIDAIEITNMKLHKYINTCI